MTQDSFDWTSFTRKVYIKASKEVIFDMWMDPGKITKFWLADAAYTSEGNPASYRKRYPQAGDSYKWKFSAGPFMHGKILQVKENELLKFTFGKKYEDSDENVVVTVAFYENVDDTWIELRQENIGEDERGKLHYYVSCQLGWMNALMNLKSVVEKDYDLREIDEIRAKETVGISLDPDQSILAQSNN